VSRRLKPESARRATAVPDDRGLARQGPAIGEVTFEEVCNCITAWDLAIPHYLTNLGEEGRSIRRILVRLQPGGAVFTCESKQDSVNRVLVIHGVSDLDSVQASPGSVVELKHLVEHIGAQSSEADYGEASAADFALSPHWHIVE